jgi:hypothetical protein
MKLNNFTKRLSLVGRWTARALLCFSAIVFILQGAFFLPSTAVAAPGSHLFAAADVGDRVQGAADEIAGRSKDLIRDTTDKVEKTANKNAAKVDRADDRGGFFASKANRDRDRIEQKAERDAARTQAAVDKSKRAVDRTAENLKDALD